MKRGRVVMVVVILLAVAGIMVWWKAGMREKVAGAPPVPPRSQVPVVPAEPRAGERLLEGYGDEATAPIEDLRKLHHVLGGYFSVIKDPSRFPIGGNADLAAALRGENANREVFLPAGHAIFSKDGLIQDRWGTPVIVHPEGWRQIELRSAGPDKKPYTEDDLVILPTGLQASP